MLHNGSYLGEARNHEVLAVPTTAGGVGFTAAETQEAAGSHVSCALVTVETAPIRYTQDGTVPTATVGHEAPVGATIIIVGHHNITRFLAIANTATASSVQVTYFS